jgi:L-serine dehydratase
VQIPCIERNVFAATQALTSADYALLSDGSHRISFDEVVTVMKQTGVDLPSRYRETSSGGLARIYRKRGNGDTPQNELN